ncbi:MAG: hypothetical protein ACOYXT_22675 [Bacteroidota bacterium]
MATTNRNLLINRFSRQWSQTQVFRKVGDRAITPTSLAATVSKRLHNAYNMAVADFFQTSDAEDRMLESNRIKIVVTDHDMVYKVWVDIINSKGATVERGVAVQQGRGSLWVYETKVLTADFSGGKLLIKAYSLAGNVIIRERKL